MVPKQGSLDALRGRRVEAGGPAFLLSFDPKLTWREADKATELIKDARRAERLHRTGSLRPRVGKYAWVSSLGDLISRVDKKRAETGRSVPLMHDLETHGLFPWYDDREIVTSAWTDGPGRAWIVDHRADPRLSDSSLREQIEFLLFSDAVRLWGANLKFDVLWEWVKWGLRTTRFTFDLLLGASLEDENRSNSLTTLSWIKTPMGGYDSDFNERFDKSDMPSALAKDAESFKVYAGGDVDAGYRACVPTIRSIARDRKLERFYRELLHPGARVFEKVERTGWLVDVDRMEALAGEVRADVRATTAEAMGMIPVPVKAKHADKLTLGRAALKVDFLFDHPAGLRLEPKVFAQKKTYPDGAPYPSVSIKDHLGEWRHDERAGPFVRALERLGVSEKTLSTFIGVKDKNGEYAKGFLSHLRPDGRFHPTYALYHGGLWDDSDDDTGTVTGRLAAKDPAAQVLPKHTRWAKKLRQCYPAPPGMVCWQLDFSQGELRIMACLANDARMLRLYQRGVDLHLVTGARAAKQDWRKVAAWKKYAEDSPEFARYKQIRQGGKAGNFGLIFRISVDGFMEYAWKTYGVRFTRAEAEEFHDGFFELYPGVRRYHERQVELARKVGYVRNPFGRVRHLPLILSPDREMRSRSERQAINSPVQGGLSDLQVYALVVVDREIGVDRPEFQVAGSTHDSAYGYAAERNAEQLVADAAGAVNRISEPGGALQTVFGWDRQIPFPVDAEIGDTLGDLEEVGLAS